MHKGLSILLIVWFAAVVLMAVLDVLAPSHDFRVAAWLAIFFFVLVATIWLLIIFPVSLPKETRTATSLTLYLAGLFLAVYNLTWQITMAFKYKPIPLLPNVALYPFPWVANAIEWYGMIGIGMVFLVSSVLVIINLKASHQ